MLRGARFREKRLFYDKTMKYAQDYALWLRLACEYPAAGLANIPVVVGQYRKHVRATSSAKKGEQDKFANLSRLYALKHLGVADNEPLMAMHKYLCTIQMVDSPEIMGKIFQWAMVILEANGKSGLFDRAHFTTAVQERLLAISGANRHYGPLAAKLFKATFV
jgi:hypothetical protein